MRGSPQRAVVIVAVVVGVLVLAGCGGEHTVTRFVTVTRAGIVGTDGTIVGVNLNRPAGGAVVGATDTPNVLKLTPPSGLYGAALAEYMVGERVVTASGCLGCHLFGHAGNNGPGPALTRVGRALTRAQLTRAVRDPEAPMPSFAGLGRRRLTALVAFLSTLR